MPNEEQFQFTNRIEMQIGSVEYQVETATAAESLAIKLSLVTIARGSCSMYIKSGKGTATSGFCGTLKIPMDRNVIEAKVELSHMLFSRLIERISETAARRVTATFEINKTLTLDHDGCLIIDDSTEALIENLTWTFGLR